jgi:hypothetical protein
MAPHVPVRAMPTRVPIEVRHAKRTQGRLIHDLLEDDTPYDSWVGLVKDSSMVHHHLTRPHNLGN